MRDISISTIQTAVLIGAALIANGEPEAENLYYSVACRLARMMNLPSRPSETVLEREICVRIWWSLCMIDVWSSTAVTLPKLMPDCDDVPLPMDELAFLALSRSDSDSPYPRSGESDLPSPMLAQMVKLNRILHAVNEFNKRCVKSNPDQGALESEVQALESQLAHWNAALPSTLRDTAENLKYWAARGLGRMFVAIYLGYYHYGQLLYYQFLHGGGALPHVTSPTTRAYADRCKDHSARFCETIDQGFRTPGCDVRYNMAAHMLVISSTVQIHELLFAEDEGQIRVARARLERNFEILLRLRPYWPMLDRTVGRLRAFHRTCQKRGGDRSFVLDRWMLRFLVEFAESIEDRDGDGPVSGERGAELWTLTGI
jgi:hypothetical protein